MKKVSLSILALVAMQFCFAQIDQKQIQDPPFKKLGKLPTLGLLDLDSNNVYTTGQVLPKDMPVLVVCFSTTCDHCQAEAKDLVKNKKALEGVRIVMMSYDNLHAIKEFYTTYKLGELKNLLIGKDYRFFAPSFFKYKKFPFSALYGKDHQLLTSLEGTVTTQMIIDEFKKHKAL